MSFIYNALLDLYYSWSLPKIYVVSIESIKNLPMTFHKRSFLEQQPIGLDFPINMDFNGNHGSRWPQESLLVNIHIEMYNNSIFRPLLIKDLSSSEFVGLTQKQYMEYLNCIR